MTEPLTLDEARKQIELLHAFTVDSTGHYTDGSRDALGAVLAILARVQPKEERGEMTEPLTLAEAHYELDQASWLAGGGREAVYLKDAHTILARVQPAQIDASHPVEAPSAGSASSAQRTEPESVQPAPALTGSMTLGEANYWLHGDPDEQITVTRRIVLALVGEAWLKGAGATQKIVGVASEALKRVQAELWGKDTMLSGVRKRAWLEIEDVIRLLHGCGSVQAAPALNHEEPE